MFFHPESTIRYADVFMYEETYTFVNIGKTEREREKKGGQSNAHAPLSARARGVYIPKIMSRLELVVSIR